MNYLSNLPSFLFGQSKEELWDAEILKLPFLINDKINWYLFEAEDWIKHKKIRLLAIDRIHQFLLTIQKDSVKTRNDLKPYLFGNYSMNNPQALLREDLRQCGWLPLDSLYEGSDEWLNARMILTDASINLALHRLLIPFNRDWCFCLAEDFVDLTSQHYQSAPIEPTILNKIHQSYQRMKNGCDGYIDITTGLEIEITYGDWHHQNYYINDQHIFCGPQRLKYLVEWVAATTIK